MKIKLNILKQAAATEPQTHVLAVSENASRTYASGMIGRIGLDGLSAYEVALSTGFEGTEQEWIEDIKKPSVEAAEAALAAAERATEISDTIDQKLEAKAQLDKDTKFVIPDQLDPLLGLQTGAITSGGGYVSTENTLTDTAPKTIEVLFTAPEDISGEQIILSLGSDANAGIKIRSNALRINSGNGSGSNHTLTAGETYHFVTACSSDGGSLLYLNGVSATSGGSMNQAGSVFSVGCDGDGNKRFKGTIHRVRVFNYTMTADEVEDIWANGLPQSYMISDAMRSGNERRCIAEYLPEGILPDRWRDTSGKGNELINYGTPFYSYTPPARMDTLTKTTGVITGEAHLINAPKGYLLSEVLVKNSNTVILKDFRIDSSESGNTILTIDEIWPFSGSLINIVNTINCVLSVNDRLNIYIPGNAAPGGVEITTIWRWYGN